MILGAISIQLPKQVVGAMSSIKMKLIHPWKIGRKMCQCIKGAYGQFKELKSKGLLKTCMKVELEKVS
jgi:hypothetical protein